MKRLMKNIYPDLCQIKSKKPHRFAQKPKCLSEASSSVSCEYKGFELIDLTNRWIVFHQSYSYTFRLINLKLREVVYKLYRNTHSSARKRILAKCLCEVCDEVCLVFETA